MEDKYTGIIDECRVISLFETIEIQPLLYIVFVESRRCMFSNFLQFTLSQLSHLLFCRQPPRRGSSDRSLFRLTERLICMRSHNRTSHANGVHLCSQRAATHSERSGGSVEFATHTCGALKHRSNVPDYSQFRHKRLSPQVRVSFSYMYTFSPLFFHPRTNTRTSMRTLCIDILRTIFSYLRLRLTNRCVKPLTRSYIKSTVVSTGAYAGEFACTSTVLQKLTHLRFL